MLVTFALYSVWLSIGVGQLQGKIKYLNSSPFEALGIPHNSLFPTASDEGPRCDSPWSCCGSKECMKYCNDGEILPNNIMKCGPHRNLTVLNCICATYNEEEALTEVGSCVYDCRSAHSIKVNKSQYLVLPPNKMDVNDFMCGNEFNRTGTLCGRCQQGYYPLVYSFNMNCIQCSNGMSNWWKYVLAAYLPLTIFFFVVLFFKINVTSSHLHGFVFYSQAVSLPMMTRVLLLALRENHKNRIALQYVISFYGIWNLDFFRSLDITVICLGTDTLQMVSLDFLEGVYPLLLMVMSYFLIELYDRNFRPLVILWKPFRGLFSLLRKNWDTRTSLIDAFATFFFLSCMKFLSVTFDLLVPIKVYQINSAGEYNYTLKLYYDATVPYFGSRHLPYAIPAILVLVFFVLLPGLLLIVYPMSWFQKFLNLFPFRWYILHTFMDSFQGCYKDGTEPGTRDCRWFASLLFLSRLFLLCIGAFTQNSNYFAVAAIALVLVALLFILVEPFKRSMSHLTDINVIFILLLALWYVSLAGLEEADATKPAMLHLFFSIAALTGIFPLFYLSAIMLHWIYRNRRFGLEVIGRLQAWKRGYDQLG